MKIGINDCALIDALSFNFKKYKINVSKREKCRNFTK